MSRTPRPILVGAALAAGMALTVSGCSSSGTPAGGTADAGPSSSAPASPSPATRTLSKAELQQALLTSAEVPTGYKASPPAKGESFFETADTAIPASCQPINDIATDNAAIKPSAAVNQDYPQPAKPTAMIFSRLVSYPAGDAEKAMTALEGALKSCSTFKSKSSDNGTISSARLTVQSGPSLGDEAVTLEVAAESQGATFTVSLVDIRVGSSMAVFMSFDSKAAKAPVVPQELMAKQVAKLKAAAAG